jgi:hypothetical protein
MASDQWMQPMVRNLAGWTAASAVRTGKLWIPARHTETTLSNYTKQTFCLNGHETYPYSFLGSAPAVRFGNKCFILWCQHQTKGYHPNDVTIPIEGGKTLISGSVHHVVNEDASNAEEDYKDPCAMRFMPNNYNSPNLEAAFFPLHEGDVWKGNHDANFYLFGYPTELRRVEYDEPHVHVRQVVTTADYSHASNARYLHSPERHWQAEL